ncbi:MAG: hypothetical protein ACQEWV_01515 [Bacillota bacterium]
MKQGSESQSINSLDINIDLSGTKIVKEENTSLLVWGTEYSFITMKQNYMKTRKEVLVELDAS